MASECNSRESRRPTVDLRKRVLLGVAIAAVAVLAAFWSLFRQIDVLRKPMVSLKVEFLADLALSPEGDEVSTIHEMQSPSSDAPNEAVSSWQLPLSNSSAPFRQFEVYGSLAYSCDGKRIAVRDYWQMQVMDRNTQEVLQQFTAPNFQSGRIGLSPDGKWLASWEWKAGVRLWNTVDASHWRIDAVDWRPTIAFTADSKKILLVHGTRWELWDLATRQVVHSETLLDHSRRSVAISQNRKLLSIVTNHEMAYIWNLENRRLCARFPIHPPPPEDQPGAVCFAVDDSLLITATSILVQRLYVSLSTGNYGYWPHSATDFKVWDTAHWNCVHAWRAEGACHQIRSVPRSRQILAMDRHQLDVWELPERLSPKNP